MSIKKEPLGSTQKNSHYTAIYIKIYSSFTQYDCLSVLLRFDFK